MLVRYKHLNRKPQGAPLVIPFAARKNATLMARAQIVYANPFAEVPECDALAYVKADPYNFEIVKEGDAKVPGSEGPTPMNEGLELDADPPKPGPKKRGRPFKNKPKEELA